MKDKPIPRHLSVPFISSVTTIPFETSTEPSLSSQQTPQLSDKPKTSPLLLLALLRALLLTLLRRLLLLLLLSLHLSHLLHNLLLLDQERTENATRYSHSPSLPIVQALVAQVATVGTSHSALAVRQLAQSTDARTRNLPVIHNKRNSYTSKSLLAAAALHSAHSLLVVVHSQTGT